MREDYETEKEEIMGAKKKIWCIKVAQNLLEELLWDMSSKAKGDVSKTEEKSIKQ